MLQSLVLSRPLARTSSICTRSRRTVVVMAAAADVKARARAAVLGSFLADAATTPLHWICETSFSCKGISPGLSMRLWGPFWLSKQADPLLPTRSAARPALQTTPRK